MITQQNEEFIRLYAKEEARLRRYVSSLMAVSADVDDVMQETAIALMRKFDQYDSAHPFFNWACRFALYEVLQHRKRSKTQRRHFSDEVVEAIAIEYQQNTRQIEEKAEALAACLGKLNEQDRRLVELRYFSEETVENLAKRIEEPVARLYRNLARIRYVLASCVRKASSSEGSV
ncbi:sigma-70 family RNA polymerase sigma factor [Blastopirellula marina]|uniref:RNA polymerase sigma-70 region 2 domain-containing protein n=1 Tax=Blastopirellula marina TaxID=124 RepID=A0A2S8GPY7_9BACT|nr:sigma-70 family RNA polymerase sigma factor [Blastopirellula marina]PQO46074.1 hypothetical protein C5Y93_10890 [Blastopirellula marina]